MILTAFRINMLQKRTTLNKPLCNSDLRSHPRGCFLKFAEFSHQIICLCLARSYINKLMV